MNKEDEILAAKILALLHDIIDLSIDTPGLTTKEATIKALKNLQFKWQFEELLK